MKETRNQRERERNRVQERGGGNLKKIKIIKDFHKKISEKCNVSTVGVKEE